MYTYTVYRREDLEKVTVVCAYEIDDAWGSLINTSLNPDDIFIVENGATLDRWENYLVSANKRFPNPDFAYHAENLVKIVNVNLFPTSRKCRAALLTSKFRHNDVILAVKLMGDIRIVLKHSGKYALQVGATCYQLPEKTCKRIFESASSREDVFNALKRMNNFAVLFENDEPDYTAMYRVNNSWEVFSALEATNKEAAMSELEEISDFCPCLELALKDSDGNIIVPSKSSYQKDQSGDYHKVTVLESSFDGLVSLVSIDDESYAINLEGKLYRYPSKDAAHKLFQESPDYETACKLILTPKPAHELIKEHDGITLEASSVNHIVKNNGKQEYAGGSLQWAERTYRILIEGRNIQNLLSQVYKEYEKATHISHQCHLLVIIQALQDYNPRAAINNLINSEISNRRHFPSERKYFQRRVQIYQNILAQVELQ